MTLNGGSAVRRVLVAAGIPGAPRRFLALTTATIAVGVAVAGATLPTDPPPADPPQPLVRLLVVAVLMAVAYLARLPLRVGAAVVGIVWSEAALIIGLHLVPAGWLPAAALLGAGLAGVIRSLFADGRDAVEVINDSACLAIAVAFAAAVTAALAAPLDAAPTPALAAALAAGALSYLLAAAALAALTLSVRDRLRFLPALLDILRGKLLMFLGNVSVGLVAVTMIGRDPRWLLLLLPSFWLLQQTYRHHLAATEERRSWAALARATEGLNHLDEHAVAVAGVSGLLTLVGATWVELDVFRVDGQRRYRGEAGGSAGPDGVVVDNDASPSCRPESGGAILARSLAVGGVAVGELRVCLSRPVLPGSRERAVVSFFGDALTATLHDAATYREMRELTARSAYEAVHDGLTKLANRKALLDKGDLALRQLDHRQAVALVVLDISRFKEVNETLGHVAGDELLRAAAGRLRSCARPGELLGRLGADEFSVLITSLPEAGEPATGAALERARAIASTVSGPIEVTGVRMSAEATVGVVVSVAGSAGMTELLRRADVALRQAKASAEGLAVYDSAWDDASTDQLTLLAEFREALEVDDQLVLAMQPAVDLATGAPTGVETLIRWHHPRRGRLHPADFIHTIEDSDLLAPFTRYVIDKALAVAADWARDGLPVPISVNVSAPSLLDRQLPSNIGALLRRHQVPPRQLVLEITETVAVSEQVVIDEVLSDLRSLGVQLAVDDFGTGFSSLAFLTRVGVDELKVDRSFVMRMADSREAAAIVRMTVELGRQLGLRVVAEGVETAEQRSSLAALGCSSAQGYHFFKPMTADKIIPVLRSLYDAAQARVTLLRAHDAS